MVEPTAAVNSGWLACHWDACWAPFEAGMKETAAAVECSHQSQRKVAVFAMTVTVAVVVA